MKARLIFLFAVIASVVATVAAPVANAGTLVGPSMPASVTCNSAGRQLFIAPQVGAGTAFASEGIAFKVYYYWRASRSDPWTGKVLLVGGQEWTSFTHYREWSYSDPITGANLVSYTKYASPVPEVNFSPAAPGQYKVFILYAWEQLSGGWLYSPSWLETTQYTWTYYQGTHAECWI